MLIRRASLCASAVLVILVAGCPSGPRRYSVPSINASSAASKAMAEFDKNQDGKISGDELDKCPSLKAALADIDRDRDGAVTAEEISKRIEQWQKSKVARMNTVLSVQHNGKPLADAEVKLVPESFLGSSLVVATGKTGSNGLASVTVPLTAPDDRPGVAPGFYRVEITKQGANIPAKYNTETTLGAEVSENAAWTDARSEGLVFKLKY